MDYEMLSNVSPQQNGDINIDNILNIPIINNNITENIIDDNTEVITNVINNIVENVESNASDISSPEPCHINYYDNMMMAPAGDNNDFNYFINSIDPTRIPSLRVSLNQYVTGVRLRIAWKNYMIHLNRRIPYSEVINSSASIQGWCNLSHHQILNKYGGKYFSFVSQSESDELIEVCRSAMVLYRETGMNGRSSKIVDFIHNYISRKITEIISGNDNFVCKLEQKVKSINSSGFKRCDIVIYKNNNPYVILPFKLIRSSYAKNKNNYLENLTGELVHLVSAAQRDGKEIHILPINIIFDTIVDRDRNNIIRHIEKIKYDNTFKIYEELSSINITNNGITSPLVYDSISYILNVQDSNLVVGSVWNGVVVPVSFDESTPYRSWEEILMNLVND